MKVKNKISNIYVEAGKQVGNPVKKYLIKIQSMNTKGCFSIWKGRFQGPVIALIVIFISKEKLLWAFLQ